VSHRNLRMLRKRSANVKPSPLCDSFSRLGTAITMTPGAITLALTGESEFHVEKPYKYALDFMTSPSSSHDLTVKRCF
jgi:hypothetical protein